MTFHETKRAVSNRGVPPDGFLRELVEWGRTAPEEIFAPNVRPDDVYAHIKARLAMRDESGDTVQWVWPSRRAAMLEAMRVHAGFESTWNFDEDKDPGNPSHNPATWETGIFQVSFDSLGVAQNLMLPFAREHGIGSLGAFRERIKSDHALALEFYARLMRGSTHWAGPFNRHEVDVWLSPAAMLEIQTLLA